MQETKVENIKNVPKKNEKNFILTRSQGKTIIELTPGFDRLSAIPQLKNTFNSILLCELKKELCILDIRALKLFSDELHLGIRKIINTLYGIHVYIICGRHFDEMKQNLILMNY